MQGQQRELIQLARTAQEQQGQSQRAHRMLVSSSTRPNLGALEQSASIVSTAGPVPTPSITGSSAQESASIMKHNPYKTEPTVRKNPHGEDNFPGSSVHRSGSYTPDLGPVTAGGGASDMTNMQPDNPPAGGSTGNRTNSHPGDRTDSSPSGANSNLRVNNGMAQSGGHRSSIGGGIPGHYTNKGVVMPLDGNATIQGSGRLEMSANARNTVQMAKTVSMGKQISIKNPIDRISSQPSNGGAMGARDTEIHDNMSSEGPANRNSWIAKFKSRKTKASKSFHNQAVWTTRRTTRQEVISFYDWRNKMGDKVLFLCALYTFWYTPFASSFATHIPLLVKVEEFGFTVMMQYLADLILIIYMPLRFYISVADLTTGKEADSFNSIVHVQLRSWTFYADLISLLPFALFGYGPVQILWIRVLRCHRLVFIPKSHLELIYDQSVGWMRMFLWMWLLLHLVSCLWFYSLAENDLVDGVNGIIVRDVPGHDNHPVGIYIRLYFFCFREAVYMLNGESRRDEYRTNGQIIFMGLCGPIGGLFFAMVYAHTTILLERIDSLTMRHSEQMALIKAAMKSLAVPDELAKRISKYHTFLAIHHNLHAYNTLMQGLSVSLFIELKAFLFRKLFDNAPFFSDAPIEFVHSLILVLCEVTFSPGDLIIRQEWDTIRTLRENEYFGEISLLAQCPRLCSVRASTYCLLAEITRDKFLPILEQFQEQKDQIIDNLKRYIHAPPEPVAENTDFSGTQEGHIPGGGDFVPSSDSATQSAHLRSLLRQSSGMMPTKFAGDAGSSGSSRPTNRSTETGLIGYNNPAGSQRLIHSSHQRRDVSQSKSNPSNIHKVDTVVRDMNQVPVIHSKSGLQRHTKHLSSLRQTLVKGIRSTLMIEQGGDRKKSSTVGDNNRSSSNFPIGHIDTNMTVTATGTESGSSNPDLRVENMQKNLDKQRSVQFGETSKIEVSTRLDGSLMAGSYDEESLAALLRTSQEHTGQQQNKNKRSITARASALLPQWVVASQAAATGPHPGARDLLESSIFGDARHDDTHSAQNIFGQTGRRNNVRHATAPSRPNQTLTIPRTMQEAIVRRMSERGGPKSETEAGSSRGQVDKTCVRTHASTNSGQSDRGAGITVSPPISPPGVVVPPVPSLNEEQDEKPISTDAATREAAITLLAHTSPGKENVSPQRASSKHNGDKDLPVSGSSTMLTSEKDVPATTGPRSGSVGTFVTAATSDMLEINPDEMKRRHTEGVIRNNDLRTLRIADMDMESELDDIIAAMPAANLNISINRIQTTGGGHRASKLFSAFAVSGTGMQGIQQRNEKSYRTDHRHSTFPGVIPDNRSVDTVEHIFHNSGGGGGGPLAQVPTHIRITPANRRSVMVPGINGIPTVPGGTQLGCTYPNGNSALNSGLSSLNGSFNPGSSFTPGGFTEPLRSSSSVTQELVRRMSSNGGGGSQRTARMGVVSLSHLSGDTRALAEVMRAIVQTEIAKHADENRCLLESLIETLVEELRFNRIRHSNAHNDVGSVMQETAAMEEAPPTDCEANAENL